MDKIDKIKQVWKGILSYFLGGFIIVPLSIIFCDYDILNQSDCDLRRIGYFGLLKKNLTLIFCLFFLIYAYSYLYKSYRVIGYSYFTIFLSLIIFVSSFSWVIRIIVEIIRFDYMVWKVYRSTKRKDFESEYLNSFLKRENKNDK